MNKILSFKKIVSIGFFAAFLAVFLSAGTAQASFWDWFNLNKANNDSQQQQAAAIANADTTSSSSSSSASANHTASTGEATNITSTSAHLYGTVNPKGENVSYQFTYYNFGHSFSIKNTSWKSAAGGSNDVSIREDISGLSPGTKYSYQLFTYSSTSGKFVIGEAKSFTTSGSSRSSSSSSKSSSSSVSTGASSSSSSSVQQYTLTVEISGEGQIKGDGKAAKINCRKLKGKYRGACSAKINKGESVSLTVGIPDLNYKFAIWSDNCKRAANISTCVITEIDSDKKVSATFNFIKGGDMEISVRKTGKGAGKVTSVVGVGKNFGEEDGRINCGADCSENYTRDVQQYDYGAVTGTTYFKAVAEKGSTFGGWGGDCQSTKINTKYQRFLGTEPLCSINLDGAAKIIEAKFNEGSGNTEGKSFDLTVTVSAGGVVASADGKINCGSGNTDCKHRYGKNSTVALKATPNSGYVYAGGNNFCTGNVNRNNGIHTCKVKMTKNQNVTINFTASGTTGLTRTEEATNITSTSATLKGAVNPKGENVIYQFYYSKNSNFADSKRISAKPVVKGSSDVSVSASLYNLPSETTYYYYISAYSYTTKTSVKGEIKSFTTLARSQSSLSSSSSSSLSSSSSSSSGNASVDLKAREVKIGSAFGDYADSLTLNNANASGNESIDLKWTVSGVSSCSLSYDSNAKHLKSSVSSSDLIVSSGDTRHNTEDYVVNSSSRQTATYTLTCKDSSGNSKSDSVSVTY